MWKINPDPWELRQMFPEVARLLEDTYLNEDLLGLEIVFNKSKLKKSTTFKIQLNDAHDLHISPVDIGPCGQTEWFTWHRAHQSHADQQIDPNSPVYNMSIRAYIQLVNKVDGKKTIIHSFTNCQNSFEELIRSSLHVIRRDLGLQLSPISKSIQQRFEQGRRSA